MTDNEDKGTAIASEGVEPSQPASHCLTLDAKTLRRTIHLLTHKKVNIGTYPDWRATWKARTECMDTATIAMKPHKDGVESMLAILTSLQHHNIWETEESELRNLIRTPRSPRDTLDLLQTRKRAFSCLPDVSQPLRTQALQAFNHAESCLASLINADQSQRWQYEKALRDSQLQEHKELKLWCEAECAVWKDQALEAIRKGGGDGIQTIKGKVNRKAQSLNRQLRNLSMDQEAEYCLLRSLETAEKPARKEGSWQGSRSRR